MITIRRGWFHLASGAGLGRIIGFIGNLLLSRWLGPTDLGLFNLVTTTIQTSDVLVRFGGDFALNFELGGQPTNFQTQHGRHLAQAFSQLCTLATTIVCIGIAIWVLLAGGLFPVPLLISQRLTYTLLLLLMVACEGVCASGWEILLVTHRTAPFALKQGLFLPLRLISAAIGVWFAGFLGAMIGWSFIAATQYLWLKRVLGKYWTPLRVCPILFSSLVQLLKRGFLFYLSNFLASALFYPLLLKVAVDGGLSDIGYLRAGQILQQLFAFLPATLVPILFLRLRTKESFAEQVVTMEKPLRLIWFLLLQALFLYCIADKALIHLLFGASFTSALLPTRLLLLTSLIECLAQLTVQPMLAAGYTRKYSIWQNISALTATLLGWHLIPMYGLTAYLLVRLLYVIIPLIAFGIPVAKNFEQPHKMISLGLGSSGLLFVLIAQSINIPFSPINTYCLTAFFIVLFIQSHDLISISKTFWNRG